MNHTFYARQPSFDKIEKIVKKVIPKAKFYPASQDGFKILNVEVKKGFFSSSDTFKISYRERKDLTRSIREVHDCALSKNLTGLYNYVDGIYAQNERSKKLFKYRIETFACEFSLISENARLPQLAALVSSLASETDAIVFTQKDSVVSKCSIGQHFLNQELKLVLNSIGASEVDFYGDDVEEQFQKEESHYEDYISKIPEEQKSRKILNETLIREKGIKVNRFLPVIESEDEVVVRTPLEIAERVVVLSIVNGYANDFYDAEKTIDILKGIGQWENTTDKEKDLIQNPTDEKKSRETWKCEGIWVLLWALKIHDDLGEPGNMCDLGNIQKDKYPLHNLKTFIDEHNVARSKKEIIDAADLYYRLDWAAVDLRLKGMQMGNINPGVVYERHYALNWLINYQGQDWDNVSCDT